MNFRYSVVYIIFLCLLLPACKQSSDATSFKKKRPRSMQHFDVHIHGVECALCAQAAVDILKKIEGVHDVVCKVVGDDYENAVFQIYYDPEQSISLEQLNSALASEKFFIEN